MVLLGQARAVLPAAALSALLLLVLVPGRAKRGWALVAVGCGLAASIGPVFDVYDSVSGTQLPSDGTLRDAAVAVVLASIGAGAAWTAALTAFRRFERRLPAFRRLAWPSLMLLVVVVGVAALVAI